MISPNSYSSVNATLYGGNRSISTQSSQSFIVEPADVVFVTARQMNRVLLEKSFSGFGSLTELLASMEAYIGNVSGLVTLQLRNRDRGCSLRRAVRFRPAMPLMGIA